ncbi:rust resistance kinase Lr10-like isoform X1 [Iris pallida]|uniref:Rust resistance kinase Lr10-like isoform X1 n=1 Tax=Iris pallida TaxID=29817 RepID=A0AAX6DLN7_IRIPA|nr:rust resistance kinase Lr10-like isoform X1 [Iris pallida]
MSLYELLSILLLFLGQAITTTSRVDLANDCPPSRCSQSGPEIKLPLSLNSAPGYCRLFSSGLNLSCSDNNTLLLHSPSPSPSPSGGGGGGSSDVVDAIDYNRGLIKLSRPWAACPWQTNSTTIDDSDPYFYYDCPLRFERYSYPDCYPFYTMENILYTLTNCTAELVSRNIRNESIAGPISCLSGGTGTGYFVYAVDSRSVAIDSLPSYCSVVYRGTAGCTYWTRNLSFREEMEDFSKTVPWDYDNNDCTLCRGSCWPKKAGRSCGYNQATNQTFCIPNNHGGHGPHVALIIGLCIAAFVILISLSVAYYIYQKFDKENLTRLKVEKFLAMYKSTNPTRYTYASIKKVTKNFKHKLGQGGYGSVYKGEILDGIPVAVKMLEISRTGDEFINEVVTMGRIHHVNVVRLLGYCPEGPRRALIYEFMPNQSLDRFIFPREYREAAAPPFSMEKLQEIVLGTARGIEYLHQGCDQRILHFDIKPHNILLDRDFNPKISDFGLAKLCSRDESAITMTAARGTKGYIAPEVYSRNFGTVSHKSDVYSFGMLVLEIVSGRRNVDPSIDNQSDAYLPEWSYNLLLIQQEGSDTVVEMDCDDVSEIARKLIIVALWCIQWSPADRPSMTKVVQMLMGNSDSLEIPPKPFVSSSVDQHDVVPIPLN